MTRRYRSVALAAGMAVVCFLWFGADARAQGGYTVLASFNGTSGGANPAGGLVADSLGNLYGTTVSGGASGKGTVFELVNSGGTFTEQLLHSFAGGFGDGGTPYAGLIMDSSGNLYGTTRFDGASGYGTVFELVNSGGTYTEQVLHSFAGGSGDGAFPYAGLIMDPSGNLYGTTVSGGPSGYGTVFELVNSGGTYTEQVLHSFARSGDGANPYAGLIMDPSGNLYGTTSAGGPSGYGTVFELVNSGGTYTEQVLHSFAGGSGDGEGPQAVLIMDPAGNLYGTTVVGGASNNGTVFELVNSGGTYTELALYSFAGGSADGAYPYAGLIMDSSGNLYGTTAAGGPSGDGTVFELVNSGGTYTEQVLHSFAGGSGDGADPRAVLIMDSWVNLYGTTYVGGATNSGIVYKLGCPSLLCSNDRFTGHDTFTQTINGSISGNAATATSATTSNSAVTAAAATTAGSATTAASLAATPNQCGTNMFATGIAANGNANCAQPASTNLSDYSTLVLNNQANVFAGGKQTLAPSAVGYASLNIPNTGTAPSNPFMGDLWLTTADAHPKFQDSTNTTQRMAFLSDVTSAGSNLLSANNTFAGSNTFTKTINGSITGNAATATTALTATTAASAATANTAGYATTAGSAATATTATTAGSLAATPSQCAGGSFATGIAANGNATCAQPPASIAASQILFSSSGLPLWNGAYMGITAPSLIEASIQQIVALNGHVTAMQCYSQFAPKGSSETFTLRLNGASTTAVCTIAPGSTHGSVTGLNLPLTAGNVLDLAVSGGPGILGPATVAVVVGP